MMNFQGREPGAAWCRSSALSLNQLRCHSFHLRQWRKVFSLLKSIRFNNERQRRLLQFRATFKPAPVILIVLAGELFAGLARVRIALGTPALVHKGAA
jgi:hypothetical protein